MVVQTQHRHPGRSGVVGLHIGSANVQQYFPPDVTDVELQLDHLCIVCPLKPSFWQDQPEIHDFRLSSWLESKRNSGKLAANPAPVALIPCGNRSYRLQLMRAEELEQSLPGMTGARVSVTGIGAAYRSPADNQDRRDQDRQDRRSRNSMRTPDRRRVARLKSDDSQSSSDSH